MTVAARKPSEEFTWEYIPKHWDFYEECYRDRIRVPVNYGGAGSGKSHTTMQWLLAMAQVHPGIRVMVLRKTSPSHRQSTFIDMKRVAESGNIATRINESRMEIDIGESTVFFRGLDDPDKVKSSNLGIVWMEETTEFTWDDFTQMDLRLREGGVFNQIICTFNPIAQHHWCVQDLVIGDKVKSKRVLHSTWRDNDYLPDGYAERLLGYKDVDANVYQVYSEGMPGQLRGLIYSNWQTLAPLYFPKRRPDRLGLDPGTTNPMALVAIWYQDMKMYVRELLYRTNMSTGAFLEWLSGELPSDWRTIPMYVDPSSKRMREDVKGAGWNAIQGDNAVYDGISYVRSYQMMVDEFSTNLLNELYSYKWSEKRDGTKLDTPIKLNDHAVDAVRYAAYTDAPSLDSGPGFGDSIFQRGGSAEGDEFDWW